jgi:surface carbohydrate biosynthesis protein
VILLTRPTLIYQGVSVSLSLTQRGWLFEEPGLLDMTSFINIFKKIKFRNFKQNSVLVFDKNGEAILKEAVLLNLSYTVLPVRQEYFNLSFQIIGLCFKNWLKFTLLVYSGKRLNCRGILRNGYYLSCIEYIEPSVVIAVIDNSALFFALAKYYKKAKFISIQNGCRIYQDIGMSPCKSNIYKFMCFGNYEKDLCSKYKFDTKTYYPVGSLRGGFYKYHLSQNIKSSFDICLVSQFRVIYGDNDYEFKQCLNSINDYLSRFIKENITNKLCIASESDSNVEEEYFKKYYDNAKYISNNRAKFTTYMCMDISDVIIAYNSTAAFEAFGWGKKVLFCNLMKSEDFRFPIPDMCLIGQNNYEIFKKKLNYLLKIDYAYYKKENQKHFKYFMNYDSKYPPHLSIRNNILDII